MKPHEKIGVTSQAFGRFPASKKLAIRNALGRGEYFSEVECAKLYKIAHRLGQIDGVPVDMSSTRLAVTVEIGALKISTNDGYTVQEITSILETYLPK